MKRCTKSYMGLGSTQWTEVIITCILQVRIMKLQESSQSHTVGFYLVTTIDIAQEFILKGYSWGGGWGWRWRDTEGLEANAHLCLTGGWKHLWKVHPWVGMRLPPGRFQVQSPVLGLPIDSIQSRPCSQVEIQLCSLTLVLLGKAEKEREGNIKSFSIWVAFAM